MDSINHLLQDAGLFIFLVIIILIFIVVKNSPKDDGQ